MLGLITFKTDPFLAQRTTNMFPKGKRALELEQLKSRIQSFQTRNKDSFKTTERVDTEQAGMRQAAVRIERDQGKLTLAVKTEEKQLAKVEQMVKHIDFHLPLISFNLESVLKIWNKLSSMPAALQGDQAALHVQFGAVQQKNQALQQQAFAIRHNGAVIRQNYLAAAQKADVIQRHAEQISDNLKAIDLQADLIEEKERTCKTMWKSCRICKNRS